MKLLMHACCAPCSVYCVDTLRNMGIEPTIFWFNPNIHPYKEYEARRDCLRDYCDKMSLDVIFEEDYGLDDFCKNVVNNLDARCINYCYPVRLRKTFEYAKENGYDTVTSTLLYSIYQKHDFIKNEMEKLSQEFGIDFLYIDFREGFWEGHAKAKELGLYMQKYCGCIFSEEERYQKKIDKERLSNMDKKIKLLFATGNEYKYNLMKNRLKQLTNIELVTPKMLNVNINVIEDGKTPEENAIKKAKQYFDVLKIPTIAEDSGLYIDKFSQEDQPGLFVKRINGKEDCSDEEILNYYISKLEKYGGESLAFYRTGVCLIDKNGKIYSKNIDESKFKMTSKKNDLPIISGGILDCISIDIENNKYFNERTEEDKKVHYGKLDKEYVELVSKIITKGDK